MSDADLTEGILITGSVRNILSRVLYSRFVIARNDAEDTAVKLMVNHSILARVHADGWHKLTTEGENHARSILAP